jgi:glutamate racemase
MNKPIGIFDSGVGGLTVAKAISEILPNESFLYFADTKNIPYGEHSPEEIEGFALRIISFLVDKGIKLLAIACNYSSAVVLDKARRIYPSLPILGVLQAGARLAVSQPFERIGVLATRGTVKTRMFPREIKKLNPQKKVFQASCPPLVPLIESFAPEEEIRSVVRGCLKRSKRNNIEALVLGCTHYPLVKGIIEEEAGEVKILDPAEELAREVKRVLERENLLSDDSPRHRFFVSGDDGSLRKFVPSLLGIDIIEIEHQDLEGGL